MIDDVTDLIKNCVQALEEQHVSETDAADEDQAQEQDQADDEEDEVEEVADEDGDDDVFKENSPHEQSEDQQDSESTVAVSPLSSDSGRETSAPKQETADYAHFFADYIPRYSFGSSSEATDCPASGAAGTATDAAKRDGPETDETGTDGTGVAPDADRTGTDGTGNQRSPENVFVLRTSGQENLMNPTTRFSSDPVFGQLPFTVKTDFMSLQNMSRTRAKDDEPEPSDQSEHKSQFFQTWPYKKTASTDPGKRRSSRSDDADATGAPTVTESSPQTNEVLRNANERIGNSTPTRPSFSPRASFFACSPIPKDRPSIGVSIDDCRRIADRISESLTKLRRISAQNATASACGQKSVTSQSAQETRVGGQTEDPVEVHEEVVCDVTGCKISRTCQTDIDFDPWSTINDSDADGSLWLALDRVCQEFSNGPSDHSEYAEAMRRILTPIVEEVLTELHLNGKLETRASRVTSESPASGTE